jgi:hypothetical protein
MDESNGKAFEIDPRYERMQAISEERHGLWARLAAGPGFLLLLALLVLAPLLIALSVL